MGQLRRYGAARADGVADDRATSTPWSATSRATRRRTDSSPSSARSAGSPAARASCSFPRALSIPAAVQRLFLGVIDAANRANVSIYTMDSAGLRAESEQARTRDKVNQAAGFGINTAYSDRRRRRPADEGPRERTRTCCARMPTAASDSSRRRPAACSSRTRTTCARASSASKTTFATTTCSGTRRANDVYDGRFRKIEVKVKRSGVTVAARKGYFALRDPGGAPGQRVGGAGARRHSSRIRCRTPSRCAPARCGFPSAIAPASCRSSSSSRPPASPSSRRRTARPTRRISRSSCASSTRTIRSRARSASTTRSTGPLPTLGSAKQGEVIFYREPELAGRRLHDGDRRPRRAVREVERAAVDGRSQCERIRRSSG